ncbi:MAG: hypothetical protein AABZ60_11175 [Planctomycetota bacterium]
MEKKLTYQDADLIIKLYDLRREDVMRASRKAINERFWPKNYEEMIAVTGPTHELNTPFGQTSSYWEMVYGMAKNGIIDADYLVENNAEGLFLYARVLPYLEQFRKDMSPKAFRHAEWICQNSKNGAEMLEWFKSRIQKRMGIKS